MINGWLMDIIRFNGTFRMKWVWINTYENTIFSGLFTSINPSHFGVNRRGTRVLIHPQMDDLGTWKVCHLPHDPTSIQRRPVGPASTSHILALTRLGRDHHPPRWWDPNHGRWIGSNGGLMAFYGGLMAFYGGLIGSNGNFNGICLVVDLKPLCKIMEWSSVGVMKFPTEWKVRIHSWS